MPTVSVQLIQLYPPLAYSPFASSTSLYSNYNYNCNSTVLSAVHIPSRSKHSCSHHHFNTIAPGFCSTARHMSIMVHVTINCVNLFWHQATYISTSFIPTSDIDSAIRGLYSIPAAARTADISSAPMFPYGSTKFTLKSQATRRLSPPGCLLMSGTTSSMVEVLLGAM